MTEHPEIPRRHGSDVTTGRRIAGSLRWMTRGNPEPSASQWQALGGMLLKGDPAMDRLIDWMAEHGFAAGRTLFQRALNEGIAALEDAPEPLRAFFERVEEGPTWLDDELLARGASACHLTGLTGFRVLRDGALMPGYQASAINKTLILTGSLTRGPQRRVAETTKWWLDCTEPGGMRRCGDGFKNTLHVRLIHALIRRRVRMMPEWDTSEWGLPVNQIDMAATQLGFSVVFLLGCRLLGVPLSADDGYAVMHLWRYIGWLMGVDEHWLPQTEQQGRTLLYQILLAQAPPDASSRQLGRALMDEPLQRFYPNAGWLRGRVNRARHLSIARLFVGRQGMRDLGLPTHVLPWFPLLLTPYNLAHHGIQRLLPRGRQRLITAGRKQQREYLKTLFGPATPTIHEPTEA